MRRNTKSPVSTRSMVLDGTTKTLAMDDTCWRDLERVAKDNDLTPAEIVDIVDAMLDHDDNLSSALRAYLAGSRARH